MFKFAVVFIACAPAFGCFFPGGGGIGAARKPSAFWNGFLRAPLNPVNPGPGDTHVDPMAVYCWVILLFADFVLLFSQVWVVFNCRMELLFIDASFNSAGRSESGSLPATKDKDQTDDSRDSPANHHPNGLVGG
jgi:hypothetical protein